MCSWDTYIFAVCPSSKYQASAGMVINEVVVPVVRVHANNLPPLPINMQSVNMYDPSSGICYNFKEKHWIKYNTNQTMRQTKPLRNLSVAEHVSKIICLYPKIAIQMFFSGFVLDMDTVTGFMSFLWGSSVSFGHMSMHHVAAGQCLTCQTWPQVNVPPVRYDSNSIHQLSDMAASQCVTC